MITHALVVVDEIGVVLWRREEYETGHFSYPVYLEMFSQRTNRERKTGDLGKLPRDRSIPPF
jgi:hypothetical protein